MTTSVQRNMSNVGRMDSARARPPKIGQMDRQNKVVENDEDIILCISLQTNIVELENGGSRRTSSKDDIIHNDLSNGVMGGVAQQHSEGNDYAIQNLKNAMVTRTSFISVIEETKNLSLSDEKKRSPIHSPVKQAQHQPSAPQQGRNHAPSLLLTNSRIPTSPLQSPPSRGTSPLPQSRTSSPSPLTQGEGGRSSSPVTASRGGQTPPPIPPPRLNSGPPRVPPIAPHQSTSQVLVNTVGNVPVPAKCSSQLRKLIQSHSVVEEESNGENGSRPIYPNLPYSPYSSPCSSPRVKRKPLKETRTVSTEHNGDYVQLNQYKLQGVVGQGSYGIVKLAYNEEDDTHYAMKILSKKKLKKKAGIFGRAAPCRKGSGGTKIKTAENPLDKVYREIAIMKKLDHPNVVKLVEVLDDPEDDQLYMVFELLERGEVLEVPTRECLTEDKAWTAFRHVLLGLEYLHYQKIIHRDIKPSNLLRADSGEVKIADLGVSNEFDGQDAFLTSTVGTPAFTPPECLNQQPGEPPYSGRSADIWSLGVTLYALVYGKVPFFDENILALYNKIRTHDAQMPEEVDVSSELKDLIAKMLIKDPKIRISLQEIKEHAWVTGYGVYPMPREEDNCQLIEVTEKEVEDSVRHIPKLDTLILVKAMLKQHSFSNPFSNLKEKFQRNGRSNSAPCAYDFCNDSRKNRSNNRLPSLSETESEETDGVSDK